VYKIIILVLIGFGMFLSINPDGRTDAHRLLCDVKRSQFHLRHSIKEKGYRVNGIFPLSRTILRCDVRISGCYVIICGRRSLVDIAPGYRLDGPGIEFRWKREFPHLSRPALGPIQPRLQWVPSLSRG